MKKLIIKQKNKFNRINLLLVISGFIGFVLGAFLEPTFHQIIEHAQIISGVVEYQIVTPYYRGMMEIWSIMNQIFAFLLYIGFSEVTLSVILSGIFGMISFQALSVLIYSLSKDLLIAITSPVVIYILAAIPHGPNYPIHLMGIYPSAGTMGLSYAVLIIGLINCKQFRLGGFLLGFAPSFHASWAIFIWFIVFISVLFNYSYFYKEINKTIKYFILGFIISVLSFFYHQVITYDLHNVVSIDNSKYIYSFVDNWCAHRRPVDLLSPGPGILFIVISSLLSIWFLRKQYRNSSNSSLFLFYSIALSGIISSIIALCSWLNPETFHVFYHKITPVRYLNFNIFCFPALAIGILAKYKDNILMQINLYFITIAIFICGLGAIHWTIIFTVLFVLYIVFQEKYLNSSMRFWYLIGGILLILTGILFLHSVDSWNPILLAGSNLKNLFCGFGAIIIGIFNILSKTTQIVRTLKNYFYLKAFYSNIVSIINVTIIVAFVCIKIYKPDPISSLKDRSKDELFSKISRNKPLILLGSNVDKIQLHTRQQILLDCNQLDIPIPYASETGPEIEEILKEIYGVDYFSPSKKLRLARHGGLLKDTGKELWESRTLEEWQNIKDKFSVTNIVCYSNWELNLPQIGMNKEYSYYSIP